MIIKLYLDYKSSFFFFRSPLSRHLPGGVNYIGQLGDNPNNPFKTKVHKPKFPNITRTVQHATFIQLQQFFIGRVNQSSNFVNYLCEFLLYSLRTQLIIWSVKCFKNDAKYNITKVHLMINIYSLHFQITNTVDLNCSKFDHYFFNTTYVKL